MVVLPVPMAPSTRVTLLRGMPPSRIESRPLIPVRAKFSGVGMRFTALVSFAIGTFAMLLGEAGPRCGNWLLHPSAFERSNDREPSGSARCSPERSEERRVGKECRARWSAYQYKKRMKKIESRSEVTNVYIR